MCVLHPYPHASIEIIVANRVVDLVGEGVDLAIRAGALKDSSLVARNWLSFTGGLWASREYLPRRGKPKAASRPRDRPGTGEIAPKIESMGAMRVVPWQRVDDPADWSCPANPVAWARRHRRLATFWGKGRYATLLQA